MTTRLSTNTICNKENCEEKFSEAYPIYIEGEDKSQWELNFCEKHQTEFSELIKQWAGIKKELRTKGGTG